MNMHTLLEHVILIAGGLVVVLGLCMAIAIVVYGTTRRILITRDVYRLIRENKRLKANEAARKIIHTKCENATPYTRQNSS